MSGRCYIILCILCLTQLAIGQVLDGSVVDDEGAPIADVFVFISNSNYGVVTDNEGRFQLEVGDSKSVKLTCSQINYEIKTKTVEDISKEVKIVMTERTNELSEVNVVKKFDPRIRDRRLKRFQKALLGSNYNDRKITIVNPEELLLYHDGTALKVEIKEPLIIKNNQSGYVMRFFISEFTHFDNEDLIYKGSIFFDEMSLTRRQQAKANKTRRKSYRLGSRHFFRSLIGRGDIESYVISIGVYNAKRDYYDYQLVQPESLNVKWDQSANHYYLSVGTLIKVYDKKTNAVSYLKPLNNQIRWDINGNIVNSSEVEEYGYWSELRMASILPYDYVPSH